jgi:hypothetical protein
MKRIPHLCILLLCYFSFDSIVVVAQKQASTLTCDKRTSCSTCLTLDSSVLVLNVTTATNLTTDCYWCQLFVPGGIVNYLLFTTFNNIFLTTTMHHYVGKRILCKLYCWNRTKMCCRIEFLFISLSK